MQERPAGLGGIYYWIWHDLCKRPEPFTSTIRTEQKNAPLLFMLIFLGLGIYLALVARRYWWQILIGFLAGILVGHFWW